MLFLRPIVGPEIGWWGGNVCMPHGRRRLMVDGIMHVHGADSDGGFVFGCGAVMPGW